MAASRPTLKAAERTAFGSRTARRLRRDGLVPGVVYTAGEPARAFQADAHDIGHLHRRGPRALRPRDRGRGRGPGRRQGGAAPPGPRRAHAPRLPAGRTSTSRSRPTSRSSSRAPRSPPASRRAASSSTSSARSRSKRSGPAFPTASPSTSPRWSSATPSSSTRSTPPEGVTFIADDPEEVTIATLNPPRVEEEPEVEEETEVIGEGERSPRGPRATRVATSPPARATTATRVSPPCPSSAASAAARSDRGLTGDPILLIGLGNPGTKYAGTRHNAGFEVADALSDRWDLPRARKRFGGMIAEGRIRPGGPRVAILLPQTFMNESGKRPAPPAARSASPTSGSSPCTTRSTCPSARSGPSSAAASPATTASRASSVGLAAATSGASGSASAAPTRPTPRSSPLRARPLQRGPEQVRELFEDAADEAGRLVEGSSGEASGEEEARWRPLTHFDVDPDGVALLQLDRPTPATR